MSDVRVTCINKPNRQDAETGITHLGGAGWKWTRQQVIDSINAKSNTFFTLDAQGNRANVGVNGKPPHQWVQTYADGKWTNNLLSLPECP